MTGSGKYDSDQEIKVRIPEDIHRKLHALKITRGLFIKDVVTEALNRHFEDIKENGLR